MAAKYPHHLARLFSPTKLRAISRGEIDLVSNIYHVAGYADALHNCSTVGEAFLTAYEVLCAEYRSEYVFKNALAQRLLLERHTLDEAVLLTELRVGVAKADAVILNGTSTVYEIKSALDNLERLPSQLEAYTQVFDRVVVVTVESMVDNVVRIAPATVGVMVLAEDLTLDVRHEAESNRAFVSPERSIEILRKAEYTRVVLEAFGKVPDVPSGLFFRACRDLFASLEPCRAHDLVVEALRERKPSLIRQDAISSLPDPLKVAGLTYTLSDSELKSLCSLCLSSVQHA